MSMSGAVRMPGSSAVCTSSYCQALFYPCLAHNTHHQFWVTVISLDRRDDPDASSHPTRHFACLRQHKMMPFEPVSHFSSRKLFLGTHFTHNTLSESFTSASVLTWDVDEQGSSLSIQIKSCCFCASSWFSVKSVTWMMITWCNNGRRLTEQSESPLWGLLLCTPD